MGYIGYKPLNQIKTKDKLQNYINASNKREHFEALKHFYGGWYQKVKTGLIVCNHIARIVNW